MIPTIADRGTEISKILHSGGFCETGSRRKPWGSHHQRLQHDLPRYGQIWVVDRAAPEVWWVWRGMCTVQKDTPKSRAYKKTNQQ